MELRCSHCCENREVELKPKGQHVGAYCRTCGRWIKWVPQSEEPRKPSSFVERLEERKVEDRFLPEYNDPFEM